jgi:hypothetical protein
MKMIFMQMNLTLVTLMIKVNSIIMLNLKMQLCHQEAKMITSFMQGKSIEIQCMVQDSLIKDNKDNKRQPKL